MLIDDLAGVGVLFFAKFFLHFLAARIICKAYKDHRPKEFNVSIVRTFVGLLAGMAYAPVMEKYGFTPWSKDPRAVLFILGMIPASAVFWWWCVMWFFEQASMRHEKPLWKSVIWGMIASVLADVLGLLPILDVKRLWVV